MQTGTYQHVSTRNQTGCAVVFFHEVQADSPIALLRAVPLTDLRPTNPTGSVRERGICQARIADEWCPCIVVEINELRTLAEQIVKVQESELHLERRGEKIALEFGFPAGTSRTAALNRQNTSWREPHGQKTSSRHERHRISSTSPSSEFAKKHPNPSKVPREVVPHHLLNFTSVSRTANTHPEIPTDEDDSLIYKMTHSGFCSSNTNPTCEVPPFPASLASLPKTIYSHFYKRDVKVADLRYGMWQRNTWHEASREAIHCLFSTDDMVSRMATVAGALMRNRKPLDPKRLDVVYELSEEICKGKHEMDLARREFGKHIGTQKSCLRRSLGLPLRYKSPRGKNSPRKVQRRDSDMSHETDESDQSTVQLYM